MKRGGRTLAGIFAAIAGLGFTAQALGADVLRTRAGDNMLLQADEVIYDVTKQTVTAHGKVEIDYGGRILLADSVSYDQKTDIVTADGHVESDSAERRRGVRQSRRAQRQDARRRA